MIVKRKWRKIVAGRIVKTYTAYYLFGIIPIYVSIEEL